MVRPCLGVPKLFPMPETVLMQTSTKRITFWAYVAVALRLMPITFLFQAAVSIYKTQLLSWEFGNECFFTRFTFFDQPPLLLISKLLVYLTNPLSCFSKPLEAASSSSHCSRSVNFFAPSCQTLYVLVLLYANRGKLSLVSKIPLTRLFIWIFAPKMKLCILAVQTS